MRAALKLRAAAAGISLRDYLLRKVTRVARSPTPADLDARIRARGSATITTAEILEARDAGRREMDS